MNNNGLFFNDNFSKLPPIAVINCRNLINLSHNEVHHPEYSRLFSEFSEEYSVELISKYPIFEEAHALSCANHSVDLDQLLLVPGSDFAINLLMSAIGINTEGLIIQSPNYRGYFHYAQLHAIKIQEASVITPDLLRRYKNCMVVISNPEGFFGSVISLDAMMDIVEVCVLKNHLLIIDEAYVEFNSFSHQHFLNSVDNIILVRSYSKGIGLASMRLGVVMASRRIISYLSRFPSQNCISDIALSYLIFLFQNKSRWKKINAEICLLRNSLTEKMQINFPLWKIYPSNANFITIGTRSNLEAISITNLFLEEGIRVCLFEEKAVSHCVRISMPTLEMANVLLKLLNDAYINFENLK